MSLKSLIQLTIGSARIEHGVSRAKVSFGCLPEVNSARVVLPIETQLKTNVGDSATLAFDSGDGWQTVFEGSVRGIRYDFQSQTLLLADASAELAAYRPNQTFQAQEAFKIAKSLCDEVGVSINIPPPPFALVTYAAHSKLMAAQHIASLARLTGTLAVMEGSDACRFVPLTPLLPTKALTYGRDFFQWTTRTLPRKPQEWVAVGHGPAGVVQAPNAHLQAKTTLPDNPNSGAGVIRRVQPLLKTPLSSQTTNQAVQNRALLTQTQIKAKAIAQPTLRPGMVLQVQELPHDKHPETVLLHQVSHVWNPSTGMHTQFRGWAETQSNSLLGALGGLF